MSKISVLQTVAAAMLITSCLHSPAATQPVQYTCLTGTIAPRVSMADLATAQAVVGVKVEKVELLPYTMCRATMVALTVEGNVLYKVGERFRVDTHCANADTLLEHPDEWIYSDIPVAGEEGRLYIPPYDFVPPGSHYVANDKKMSVKPSRDNRQVVCSG